MKEPDTKVDVLAHRVIGAAIEVHKILGPGYLESVYEEALCVELALRDIPFARQVSVSVDYKGHLVGDGRIDIIVDNCLIVELKTVDALAAIHSAQVISYLKTTSLQLALLINFHAASLKEGIKRVVLT